MVENDNTTVDKTLWSETIIELLCIALQANKPDKQIKELLFECKKKEFKASYLLRKVRKEVDETAATRIKGLM